MLFLNTADFLPVPISAGSTPAVADETILQNGVNPRALASAADINSTTAAPSLIPAVNDIFQLKTIALLNFDNFP